MTNENYKPGLKVTRIIFLICIFIGILMCIYFRSGADDSFGAIFSIIFFASGLSYISLCSRQGYKNLWIIDKILLGLSLLTIFLGLIFGIYLIFK
jgi:hypothetical protein